MKGKTLVDSPAPCLTRYTIFSAPTLGLTVIPFLDAPTPKGP
jgi:hypothetical protein